MMQNTMRDTYHVNIEMRIDNEAMSNRGFYFYISKGCSLFFVYMRIVSKLRKGVIIKECGNENS